MGNGSYNMIGIHKYPFTQKKIKFYRNINLDLFFFSFQKICTLFAKTIGFLIPICQFEILITYFRDKNWNHLFMLLIFAKITIITYC